MGVATERAARWRLLTVLAGLAVVAAGAGAWWLGRERCRTLAGHRGAVRAVALSADGRVLVSGGQREVRVWDFPAGTRRAVFELPGEVTAVAVSADGQRVAAAAADGTVQISDADGREPMRLRADRKGAQSLLFLAGGKSLLTGGGDRVLRLWDVAGGKETAALVGHKGAVYSLAVAADGVTVASGGAGDDAVLVWQLPGKRPLRRLTGHAARVLAVAFTGPGTLVSGDRNGVVKQWDVTSGRELASVPAHGDRVSGLAPTGDGGLLSSSEDGGLARWPLPTFPGTPLRWQQRSPVTALALSPDGRRSVTAGADGLLRIWDVPSNATGPR